MEEKQVNEESKEGAEESHLVASHLGRLYELGFNTGLLTTIQQNAALQVYFGDLYTADLRALHFPALAAELYKRTGIINPWDKETLQQWALLFLQKGFFSGLNFFAEYLQSFEQIKPHLTRHVVYLQCNFYGENSLGTYAKNERAAIHSLMQQFHEQNYPVQFTEEDITMYTGKGHFLRADALLLLKYGRHWRILCIDLSAFSVRALEDLFDLTNVEQIRRMLSRELRYFRSKSVFTNLSIDTDTATTSQELLSGQLKHYFTAFKRQDKESVKLIQAASYAYSFYEFLKRQGMLKENDDVLFNVVGYTDRNLNTMSVKKENLQLLATCMEIYTSKLTKGNIADARDHVLETVQKAAARSFDNGRDFVKKLIHLADTGEGPQWLAHQEKLAGFVNTRAPLSAEQLPETIRTQLDSSEYDGKHILDIHAALTQRELASKTPYLFLTGNPGIGKTTTIVNFLKMQAEQGRGFLFFYVSPRKQVNLDIINKFRQDTGLPPCERLFAVTANSVIIRNNASKPTVHYYSEQRQDTFQEHGVSFIPAEGAEARQQKAAQRRLEEIEEGLLVDRGERISGVLDSLCKALYATIEKPLSNAIVATVAIQSLKRREDGKNTLRHLEKIFQGAYTPQGEVIPERMKKLCEHIQYFIVMIDEVTGDESGAEFLDGLHRFLQQYQLIDSPYGITTKIIVADASIVDPQIIRQHLADTSYEPDKIYFRRVAPQAQQSSPPLTLEHFEFKKVPAAVINANAYPASALHITYKIGVDALQYDEGAFPERSKLLRNALQTHIIKDIVAVLEQQAPPQVLVYIQDKQRLALLIQEVRKARGGLFTVNEDYLEIHTNISEMDKQAIEQYKEQVKVVFMTASASRGLSFTRATHILVDIPHFEIEQNLMEILQVIYRGRGGEFDQVEKYLTFYLTDQIIYSDSSDRALSVRESMLHLLNVLIILKTSMMTRIVGSGQVGLNQRFMMIPIGGKSVFAAGETFTSRIGKLLKELQDLEHRHWNDKRLTFVRSSLVQILEHAQITLMTPNNRQRRHTNNPARQSYIPLVPTFSNTFTDAIRKGFQQLLQLPPLELAYITGGMLIVPIVDQSIQEAYWMEVNHLLRQERKENQLDLLECMRDLSRDHRYPESLHVALRDAIALTEALKAMTEGKIPHYEQQSNHADQYYALPLVSFLAHKEMKAYFGDTDERDDSTEVPFRLLLSAYIRSLYPADNMLPLGRNYDEFPFVIFRSLNLGEARRKMFTDKYLFMSHELNILNMLLSSKE